MMLKSALTLSVLTAITASSAYVEAAVARHERVEVKEITKNKEVVGIKIKLTVRPEGYETVRIGLNTAGKKAASDHRAAASDMSKGHLLHQFAEVKLDGSTAKPVELKVLYKDNPNLKPGDSVEIVSAFNKASNASYWHVFGMTGAGGTPEKYTTPGKAQAAAKRRVGVNDIRRAGKQGARRRAHRRAKRTNTRSTTRRNVRKPAARKPTKARARR